MNKFEKLPVQTKGINDRLFSSAPFLLSVMLLAVNDWILKPAFGNWLTGKLSDFAGLTAFTLFFCALFPRHRWRVATTITLSFIYWKLPFSDAVISAFNQLGLFSIGRTVDYTDFIALPVVWIAAARSASISGIPARRLLRYCLAATSLVLFTATSRVIPMRHEVAELNITPGASLDRNAIDELETVLNQVTSESNLTCSPCEPITDGRMYRPDRSPHSGLFVRLNTNSNKLYLTTRTATDGDSVKAARAKLAEQLPTLKRPIQLMDTAALPRHTIYVGVKENQLFYSKTSDLGKSESAQINMIVENVATKYALQKSSRDGMYYFGKQNGFFDPWDRELTMYVSALTVSYVTYISITTNSPAHGELKKSLHAELLQQLKTHFDGDRLRQ